MLWGASASHDVKCFALGQAAKIGPAFPDQLEREVRPQTVDLGEVDAEDRVEGRAGIERRSIGLAGPFAGPGKQLIGGRCGALLQPLQDCLDLLVAGRHLGLVDVVQLERLGQGEDVLLPVIANQRLAHRLHGRMAPPVTVGSQDLGSRSPATIARMMDIPVTPVMSDTT